MQSERKTIETRHQLNLLQSLTDIRVVCLSFIYFASATASYGIAFFLPQIVKGLGTQLELHDRRAERHSLFHRRARPARLRLFVGPDEGTPLAPDLLVESCRRRASSGWPWSARRTGRSSSCPSRPSASMGPGPSFWPMPSLFLTGTAAAAGIALINSLGNLGGYVGPMIVGWIRDSTQSFDMALYFLAACAFTSGFVTLLARNATEQKDDRGRARSARIHWIPGFAHKVRRTVLRPSDSPGTLPRHFPYTIDR